MVDLFIFFSIIHLLKLVLSRKNLPAEFTCFHRHNDIYKNKCYLMPKTMYFKTEKNQFLRRDYGF